MESTTPTRRTEVIGAGARRLRGEQDQAPADSAPAPYPPVDGQDTDTWLPRTVARSRRAVGPLRRLRRIVIAGSLVALVPVSVSFTSSMLEASNSSFSIRSVEWLRDHGAAGLVTKVETIYYTLNAPAKGGPALRKLPRVGVGVPMDSRAQAIRAGLRPRNIKPLAHPALRGEGVWLATRRHAGTHPPLMVTSFRAEPSEYPRLVAGVAWIDTARTSIHLYPGRLEPSVQLPQRGPMEVPPRLRYKLLATFNSGFKLADDHGGFALDGHTYAPMTNGQATFVHYGNGSYNIVSWSAGPSAGPDVVFARQNLPLIVDRGLKNPNLNNSAEWGATLGNAVRVWRSGIGIDAHGNLIYAAANDQTVASLAQILIDAGAVRAMELDMNSYWVSFNTYGLPGSIDPQKLLGEIERPATRYLEPDDRDFFAVYER